MSKLQLKSYFIARNLKSIYSRQLCNFQKPTKLAFFGHMYDKSWSSITHFSSLTAIYFLTSVPWLRDRLKGGWGRELVIFSLPLCLYQRLCQSTPLWCYSVLCGMLYEGLFDRLPLCQSESTSIKTSVNKLCFNYGKYDNYNNTTNTTTVAANNNNSNFLC